MTVKKKFQIVLVMAKDTKNTRVFSPTPDAEFRPIEALYVQREELEGIGSPTKITVEVTAA